MRRLHLLRAIALLAMATALQADTTFVEPGNVSGLWTPDGSPYVILGQIQVPFDLRLDIEPGVQVVFTGPHRFQVFGQLRAIGRAEDSIRFTVQTINLESGWGGFEIRTLLTDTTEFDYAICEFGGWGGLSPPAALHADNSVVRIRHSVFRDSRTFAIHARAGSLLLMKDCRVFQTGVNTASGGAVDLWYAQARIESSELDLNRALDGGAVRMSYSHLELTGSVIAKNRAGVWGGGIFAGDCTTVVIDRTLFFRNRALTGGSIEATVSSGNHRPIVTITRSTFVQDSVIASNSGGSIAAPGSSVLNSCIFAFAETSPAVRLSGSGGIIRHCDFFGNHNGNVGGYSPQHFQQIDTVNANGDECDPYFNLFVDPLFADTDGFHLTAASPCIDAGDPLLEPDPDGSVADIGAYYFDRLDVPERGPTALGLYGLAPNYPNPFNAFTRIGFDLPRATVVRLEVFDLNGRRVTTLVDSPLLPGHHERTFDAAALPAGLYFARLTIPGFTQTRKLVVLK